MKLTSRATIMFLVAIATISCERTYQIQITSSPSNAKVQIGNNEYQTPATVVLDKDYEGIGSIKLLSYARETFDIQPDMAGQTLHFNLEPAYFTVFFENVDGPVTITGGKEIVVSEKTGTGHNVDIYTAEVEIRLGVKSEIVASKYGYVDKKITIDAETPSDRLAEKFNLQFERDWSILIDKQLENNFIVSLVEAVNERNGDDVSDLVSAYAEPLTLTSTDFYRTRQSNIAEVLSYYYANSDWDSIVFMLENGSIGFRYDWSRGYNDNIGSLLESAIIEDDVELLLRLLNAGAPIDVGYDGWEKYDIEQAIYNESYNVMQALVEFGLDPNVQNEHRNKIEYGYELVPPLFIAYEAENQHAFDLLLNLGADINTPKIEQGMDSESNVWRLEHRFVEVDGKYSIIKTAAEPEQPVFVNPDDL